MLALAILVFHIATMFGGIAVFVAFDTLWIKIPALFVSAYGALGISMSGHNASHRTATGSWAIDRALTYLTFALIHGVSATYWRYKHIQTHHVSPNDIGIDTDIDLMPFFALSQKEIAQARGWRRKFYRVQHWIFPFALSLNLLNMKMQGFRHLCGELRGPRKWRAAVWADVACVSVHVAIFIVVPIFFWPAWQVIGFYLLRDMLHGYVLFAATAPAHFPVEAHFVKIERTGPNLLAGQIYTTVNFRTGFWGWLAVQGVEHQIEHHILPEANPLKLARVREIIEPFCHRHGYPYRSFGWWEAIVKSLLALRHPRPIHRIDDLIARQPERTS
jgi:fatty acid desaturase